LEIKGERPYKLQEYLETLYVPKKMRYATLKGYPKELTGKIWRIVSRIDSLKIEMIGKHNNKYNSEELYHFYRDQVEPKTSEKI